MKFADEDGTLPVIDGLTSRVEDRTCTLRWRWPEGAEAVMIHKGEPGADAPDHPPAGLRLYTKEEYKANNGYHDRMDEIGLVEYTVYVRISEGGEALLVRQSGEANRLTVSAAKARIRYGVSYRKGLFRKGKTVHITVTAEAPVAKEALCYVKKKGGYPAGKDDGIRFPFVQDFQAGRNALPPVEVGGDEYVRVFFTDGPKYARFFELVPE